MNYDSVHFVKGHACAEGIHNRRSIARNIWEGGTGRVTFMIATCRHQRVQITIAVQDNRSDWMDDSKKNSKASLTRQIRRYRHKRLLLDRHLPSPPLPLSWNLAAIAEDVHQDKFAPSKLTKSRWSRPFLFLFF